MKNPDNVAYASRRRPSPDRTAVAAGTAGGNRPSAHRQRTSAPTPTRRRASSSAPRRATGPVPYREEPVAPRRSRDAAPSGNRYRATERARESERRAESRAKRRAGSQTDLMRYAADNRFIRWFYEITTGPSKVVFYGLIALVVVAGVYFPVRDWYVAVRTEAILKEQKQIRIDYNESIGKEVEGYLSQEGIEDAARKNLGMAMPGEKVINVEGLDEDGNPVVVDPDDQGDTASEDIAAKDTASEGEGEGEGDSADQDLPAQEAPASSDAEKDDGKLKGSDARDKDKTSSAAAGDVDPDGELTSSAQVEKAEKGVFENSAWYWKLLDALFFFDGENGIAVVSTGE